MKRFWIILCCIVEAVLAIGQDTSGKIKLLSEADFIAIVKAYHPVIRQADIGVQKAAAELTIARGGFDPAIYLNSDQKTFDGKHYYSYTNPELKIPTWYGIEVKAGLENNGGEYLTQEATRGQTSYIGISVPLAKNLLMDKRRAVLQQAKIFREQSVVERLNIVNDLLMDAYEAYWNWAREQEVYRILTNTVQVNEERFRLTKIGFNQGDRPAIDTIEALTQLQSFQFMQSESSVRVNNAAVDLSNYLWLQNNTWYQLPGDVLPDDGWLKKDINDLQVYILDELLYAARLTHPKLRTFDFKLQQLEIDRRLKFQSLLPTINVRANLLNKGYNMFDNFSKFGMYENNNKFGLEIGLPLRLSEGRGGYKLAKLKIQETNLELSLQKQAVENKVTIYYNQLTGLQQQVKLYESAYNNYQTLFRGEDIRFRGGESSLFLLNSRETKLLEALQKLVELKSKYYKTRQSVQWAAGQLR